MGGGGYGIVVVDAGRGAVIMVPKGAKDSAVRGSVGILMLGDGMEVDIVMMVLVESDIRCEPEKTLVEK